jgi:hypothetical protein
MPKHDEFLGYICKKYWQIAVVVSARHVNAMAMKK